MPMQYERKRTLSFFIVGGFLFLGGCEYAVILPTCMSYLKTLGATNEYWLGFTVSAYSISAAISGMIGGRLSDIYEHHTKTIAMVSIILMIFGSFQYTVGITVWNVFISRLICGCGTAAGSAMLAEVCRVTAVEERTPILAICNACRQLGILVGPVFQLIMTFFNFKIGQLEVNPLNAAGIFMAGLWLVFSIMTYFMFFNLSAELKEIKRQQRRQIIPPVVVTRADRTARPTEELPKILEAGPAAGHQALAQRAVQDWDASANVYATQSGVGDSMATSHARRTRLTSMSGRFMSSLAQSGQKSVNVGQMSLLYASGVTLADRTYLREFLTDFFILMLSMVFTLFFCQMSFETVIPVVMQEYFGFGEFSNSIVYMVAGGEAMTVFFSVAIISRYVRDTNLMLIGWISLILGHVWLLVFLPQFQYEGTGSVLQVAFFMIALVLLTFGYAVSSVANTGLFSKCLSVNTQGLGQGLRRMISYVGLIFGPTWAGAWVRKPYMFVGVPLLIIFIHTIMFAVSFKDLRRIEKQHRDEAEVSGAGGGGVVDRPPLPEIQEDEERRPLIR